VKVRWKMVSIVCLVLLSIGLVGYSSLCSLSHTSGTQTIAIRPARNSSLTLFPSLPLVASPGTAAHGPFIYELRYCLPAIIVSESKDSGWSVRLVFLEPGKTISLSQ
jgi:hypothetical protein